MADWKEIIVQAVRNAPDEVILDLVRTRLAGTSGAEALLGAPLKTSRAAAPAAKAKVGDGTLVFHPREELRFEGPAGSVVVASGASTRLLRHLVLARKEDEAAGGKASAVGWRASADVAKALKIKLAHLNVLTYRARGAIKKAGLGEIVERHQPTASIRIALPGAAFTLEE